MKYFFAMFLSLVCSIALASAPVITIQLPTTNTDGSPITPGFKVRLYKGTKADGSDKVLLTSFIGTTYTDTGAKDSTLCYFADVISASGIASAIAGPACKDFTIPNKITVIVVN